ncbi:MAG: hypothetical protein ACI8XM_001022 [Haloarculaceae archaeon]|jgi:hypothetical protein
MALNSVHEMGCIVLVNRRIVFGATLVLLACVGLFVFMPPRWVPWSSPVNLFGLLYLIPGAALISIVGGAFIAREAGKPQSSRDRTFAIATGGTVAALVPVYGYAVYRGLPMFTPLWIPLLVIAGIVGLVTGWLTVYVPSIPHWMNRWL